jgi:hypothetical protein
MKMKIKSTHNVMIVISFIVFFIIILILLWANSRTLSEPFSAEDDIQMHHLDLSNTTLRHYYDKWGNSNTIRSSSSLTNHYGHIFIETGDPSNIGKMLTWDKLPETIDSKNYSISFWLYVNSLTNGEWQNIYRVQSEQNYTDRIPGVWLWPSPWPYSAASLHIRRKALPLPTNSNNTLNDQMNIWNGGDHDDKGLRTVANWQTYWRKEIEDNAIRLKVPMFCTIVFENRKYRLYIDGKLKNEYEHENDPDTIHLDAAGKNKPLITVCGDMFNESTYFIKDFHIHVQPLEPAIVKRLYERVQHKSDLEGAVNAAKLATTVNTNDNKYSYFYEKDSGGYDIPGAAYGGATVESCKATCDNNPECAGFAYHVPYNTCYPKYNTMYPKGASQYQEDVDLYVKNSQMNMK